MKDLSKTPHGEDAIKPRSVINVGRLLVALLKEVQPPEICIDPDGEISMDWIISRENILSIGVTESNRVVFAWLYGGATGHGVEEFDGENAPAPILKHIKAMFDLVKNK